MQGGLVLLGPPGAGKGTQAKVLAERLHAPHLSTGDMLRHAVARRSAVGQEAESYMSGGQLVPDAVVNRIVEERLADRDCRDGFILDGFPRNRAQAEELEAILQRTARMLAMVLAVTVDEAELVRRLSGRRTCEKCSAPYHVEFKPPAREGACDVCGGALVLRNDDRPDVVRERVNVYRRQTEELLEFYRHKGLLREVSGMGFPEEIASRILKIVLN
jgi:adenylate kinase